jgi:hypothetical protein
MSIRLISLSSKLLNLELINMLESKQIYKCCFLAASILSSSLELIRLELCLGIIKLDR